MTDFLNYWLPGLSVVAALVLVAFLHWKFDYVRKAGKGRPLTPVTPSRRCIVHDTSYTTVCSGCRADQIAAEETA